MIIAGTFPQKPERTRRPARPDPPSNELPPDVPGPRSGGRSSSEADDRPARPVKDETPPSK